MNTRISPKLAVLLAIVVLVLSSLACDNGGTIRPDAGCVGQQANFDSCRETIQTSGEITEQAISDTGAAVDNFLDSTLGE